MKAFITILLLIFFNLAHAGLEKLIVDNLDLEYKDGYGAGSVDRVGIGLGLTAPEGYLIELKRTENSIDLTSPYVDFSWIDPLKFIYEIEAVSAKKTNTAIGTKTHFVQSEYFMVKPKDRGEYKAFGVDGTCEGQGTGNLKQRLLVDCHKKLNFKIKKVDVPTDFILYKLLEVLPPMPRDTTDVPADNVVATITEGELYLQLYIKYWVYAGLRTWGKVQYEDNFNTIAIRVDQIKFGYIPVTSLVMKKLQEVNTNPDIKIDPPWIRINIESL